MRKRDRSSANAGAEQAPPTPEPEPQGDGAPAADARAPGDGRADEAVEPDPADVDPRVEAAGAGPASAAGQDAGARQLEEQRDKYLRLAAEYDNYRKRTAKERIEAGSRGQAELAAKLLDALDDLQRFADVDPASTDAQTLHKGIELVEQKMLKALAAAGLEVVNPVDQTFDPTLHEAVATEPALSTEDDHVVAKVFQPGYRFNGQLLRPARVVVKQWKS